MKEILLFPGAFNPPHNGHISIIKAVLEKMSFDEIWLMPSGKREDKDIHISYEDRRNLGGLLVEYLRINMNLSVKLITAELDDKEERYTQDILKEVKAQPNLNITQLIGLDGYLKLQKNFPNEIADESFIIVKRKGYEFPVNSSQSKKTMFLDIQTEEVSSTEIRDLVKMKNEQYKQLVPEEIATYIEEKNLYL